MIAPNESKLVLMSIVSLDCKVTHSQCDIVTDILSASVHIDFYSCLSPSIRIVSELLKTTLA